MERRWRRLNVLVDQIAPMDPRRRARPTSLVAGRTPPSHAWLDGPFGYATLVTLSGVGVL